VRRHPVFFFALNIFASPTLTPQEGAMNNYILANLARKAELDGRKVYTFLASSPVTDRQNEIVTADGWQLDNYRRNPVILDSHDYMGGISAIVGHTSELRESKDGLEADVVFNNTPKGQLAQQLVDAGDLRAVSVGFSAKEIKMDPKGETPLRHTKKELLEISVVAVPANQEALRLRMLDPYQTRSVETDEQIISRVIAALSAKLDLKLNPGLEDEPLKPKPDVKGPIPPQTTPKADEGLAWDAGAELQKANGAAQLRAMCAWVDGSGDPDLKSSYKMPHHLADGAVVWRGVSAAMAVLLGARGGVQIPDGDRRGVWTHLARHYEQFDKTPPEFKTALELDALGPEEIKGLFWEHEFEELPSQKAGRRISASTANSLSSVKDKLGKLRDVIEEAESILDDLLGGPNEPDEADSADQGQDDGKSLEVDLDIEAIIGLLGQMALPTA
jgi:HK97 family phage prohead protease